MNCLLCGSSKSNTAFSLGNQPLANKYPKDSLELKKERVYEMNIDFCQTCCSCQINLDISRATFFKDYYYLSSVNHELVKHFEDLAIELSDKKYVVDIGSNDGILLRPLKKSNTKCIGVDPSENVGALANSEGLKTIISFFNEKSAREIYDFGGTPDCIVASSVFTHLNNHEKFLEDVYDLLAEDGVFIIEVEYLLNIIDQLQFERFYFDRPFYFSLISLDILFKKFDLKIVDVKRVATHGGSLRVYIKKSSCLTTVSSDVKKILSEEKKLLDMKFIHNRFKEFNKQIDYLKDNLLKFKNKGLKVVGYGAPARLATITNFGQIDHNLLDYVIDDSVLKAGCYSPGKHIPIKSFENSLVEDIDIIILFAYEYFGSIVRKFNTNEVTFFKPIPFDKIDGVEN